MKQIITALGNPYLNNELKKEKEFNIVAKDIQYQDGIFEVLQNEETIDFLILSEILLGQNKIEDLIQKIREKNHRIKILVIMEQKKEELEEILYLKGVVKVYYNNEVELEEIVSFIKNEKKEENEKIRLELEHVKELLIQYNIYSEKENHNLLENKRKEQKEKKIKVRKKHTIEKKKQIISIAGTGGVGKSIVTLNIANLLKEKQQKILILDFDILNNSLHTILGVNQYPQKIKQKLRKNNIIQSKLNIKELIIKINKKVDLISGINLLFDSKYKISSEKIQFILEELKQYYDTIIIDTSCECFFDYTKNILHHCDKILFLLEANLVEIKKANQLLNIYTEEWKLKKENINIIINKYNENAIDDKIIKHIFSEYPLLGKIKFNPKYNHLINKNFKEDIFTIHIKKEYEKIINKMIKLKDKKRNLTIENLCRRFKFNLNRS